MTAFINGKEIVPGLVDGGLKVASAERSGWLETFYETFGPILIDAYQLLEAIGACKDHESTTDKANEFLEQVVPVAV